MGGFRLGLVLVVAALLFTIVAFTFACERVDVGNVGIKINTLGDVRGVEHSPTVSGWVWYNPFSQSVIEFSTVVQTVVWDRVDGEPDESINFGSSEGLNVNADVSVSFRVDPGKAPRLYAKYRQADLEVFAHGFLRNQVKDAINEEASRMPVQGIYGEGKSVLLRKAHNFLDKKLNPDGVLIDQLTFNSHLRLPSNVQQAIDQSIAQTQEAQRAQYRVKQVEAEASQNVAKANGEAQATRARSEAEAAAILATAEAQAKANQLIRESLTGNLIEYEKIKRWDGKLPMIGGTPSTIVDLRTVTALGDK
jgi:regulator of protease activity HflC (stomatin/prohibitin superfamily)